MLSSKMQVEKPLITAVITKHQVTQQQQQNQIQDRKVSLWTKEKINQLIELYKKHECLWNYWNESYKNKDKRNRAIEDICKTLNIPKFEFGKKIHNLRNQFNTEMKKLEQRIEEAGVNIDDINSSELRCKWSHFDSLKFLRHVIEPRPGGYQANLQPPKKMRLKFEINNSEEDVNVTTVLANSSGSSNVANQEDLSQFQYEDHENEEVITDHFQSFENETLEVNQRNCGEETCDQKYQPTQQLELSSRSFIKSTKNKKPLNSQQSSAACSSSQTDISINEDTSVIGINSNYVAVASANSHISTNSFTSITTPIISSITSSSSSNRPVPILRDQWDAFGELLAYEFRNLNSEISRKRLKRKIMQAMLEVGEDDDNLAINRLKDN